MLLLTEFYITIYVHPVAKYISILLFIITTIYTQHNDIRVVYSIHKFHSDYTCSKLIYQQ